MLGVNPWRWAPTLFSRFFVVFFASRSRAQNNTRAKKAKAPSAKEKARIHAFTSFFRTTLKTWLQSPKQGKKQVPLK
jgi:hypothetical protein